MLNIQSDINTDILVVSICIPLEILLLFQSALVSSEGQKILKLINLIKAENIYLLFSKCKKQQQIRFCINVIERGWKKKWPGAQYCLVRIE